MKQQTYKSKPRKCPICGSLSIALIQYGMPVFTGKLEKELEDKKIVLGGCVIYPDSPSWLCTACNTALYRECGVDV